MRHLILSIASALLVVTCSGRAQATPLEVTISGAGVSGHITFTYGTATDARYSQGYQITGASGTFTDTNNGLKIVNATITGVEGLNPISPEPGNLLTPDDFSGYKVAKGLAPEANGYLHYDNLFYPGGSPGVATNYPFGGGVLDIYGVLFDIGNNQVVNLWSNGIAPFAPMLTYGVAVATHDQALDYVSENVALTQTPEPSTLGLLGTGVLALLSRCRLRRS